MTLATFLPDLARARAVTGDIGARAELLARIAGVEPQGNAIGDVLLSKGRPSAFILVPGDDVTALVTGGGREGEALAVLPKEAGGRTTRVAVLPDGQEVVLRPGVEGGPPSLFDPLPPGTALRLGPLPKGQRGRFVGFGAGRIALQAAAAAALAKVRDGAVVLMARAGFGVDGAMASLASAPSRILLPVLVAGRPGGGAFFAATVPLGRIRPPAPPSAFVLPERLPWVRAVRMHGKDFLLPAVRAGEVDTEREVVAVRDVEALVDLLARLLAGEGSSAGESATVVPE